MDKKLYWNQHRVYFIARAVYFPEQILGSIVAYNDLEEYFPDGYEDYLTLEAVDNKTGKILTINKLTIQATLDEYLNDFYFDRRTTLKKLKPEQFSKQLLRLLTAVRSKKEHYGTRPIIDLTDIWPHEEGRIEGMTPFWELLFAEARVGTNIEVVNIGYEDEYVTNTGATSLMPYAEIKLRFGSIMYQDVMHIPKLRKAPEKLNFNTKIELRDYGLAVVRGDEEVPLKRLQRGRQYHNLAKYLLEKQDAPIQLSDVIEDVGGAKRATDLTELIRLVGFDIYDKKLFFVIMKPNLIQFRSKTNLTPEEFSEIRNRKRNRK